MTKALNATGTTEPDIKKKLDEFNKKFKEIYEGQKQFKVMSSAISKRIKESNLQLILPKYDQLLKSAGGSARLEKHIKYKTADVEAALSKFFTKS